MAPDEHRYPPPGLPPGQLGPPPPQVQGGPGENGGPGTFPRAKKSHCKYQRFPLLKEKIDAFA